MTTSYRYIQSVTNCPNEAIGCHLPSMGRSPLGGAWCSLACVHASRLPESSLKYITTFGKGVNGDVGEIQIMSSGTAHGPTVAKTGAVSLIIQGFIGPQLHLRGIKSFLKAPCPQGRSPSSDGSPTLRKAPQTPAPERMHIFSARGDPT